MVHSRAALPIELKAKRFAEGCQRSFGGVGFSCLEGDIVDLTRGGTAAFSGAMAFSNDGGPFGMHGDAHPCDVDGEEGAAVFAGKDAAGFNRLPVPAIKSEYAVGFRDHEPTLYVRKLPAIGFAGADLADVNAATKGLCLF